MFETFKKIKHSFVEIPVFDSRNDSIFKATFGTFGLFWLWWKGFDRELLASSPRKEKLLNIRLMGKRKPAASDNFEFDYRNRFLELRLAKFETFFEKNSDCRKRDGFFSGTISQLIVLHKYKRLHWKFDGRLQAYKSGKRNFASAE